MTTINEPSATIPSEAARDDLIQELVDDIMEMTGATAEAGWTFRELREYSKPLTERITEFVNHFPPTEATQAGVEAPNAMSNAVHELVERWFMDDLPERARAFPSGPQRLRILAQQVISKHCAAEAGEVEREVIQANRLWRIWLWNELQIDVRLSDDAARNEAVKQLADARTNTITKCVEKLNALSTLPFDAVPYIRRDDAVAALESLRERGPQQVGQLDT